MSYDNVTMRIEAVEAIIGQMLDTSEQISTSRLAIAAFAEKLTTEDGALMGQTAAAFKNALQNVLAKKMSLLEQNLIDLSRFVMEAKNELTAADRAGQQMFR